ncbi:MAG: amidohydrolase family protein, partial [Calditrichaeota bacterium]|nr:amidohydrolase family protein [Calditrichota bacterium]
MTDFIIGNTWIATLKERRVLPVFGDIVLKNGMISEIRKHDFQDFLRTDISRLEDKNIVDVGGRITTVPFINFHDHFYSRLARGLIASGEMENFRQILQNLWWKLDRLLDNKLIQAAVDQGCMESLRSGVTYVFDHHASPGSITGVLPLMAKRLQDRGLRSVLCMEVSDRVGEEKAHQQLEENAEFIKTQEGPDVRGMLGLHAPFTLSDMTLEIASGLRGSLGCAIHIHLAEDAYEQEFSHERFGRSPVERLEKYHLLTPESLLVHGVHLTREDYTLIAERGSAIVLNPDSNMNNSVGLPQYGGIPQNIMLLPGTDGMHGGIGRTFKQLYLLARHQGFSFERATGWIEKIY